SRTGTRSMGCQRSPTVWYACWVGLRMFIHRGWGIRCWQMRLPWAVQRTASSWVDPPGDVAAVGGGGVGAAAAVEVGGQQPGVRVARLLHGGEGRHGWAPRPSNPGRTVTP